MTNNIYVKNEVNVKINHMLIVKTCMDLHTYTRMHIKYYE